RVTFEGIMEKPHPDTYLVVTDNPHVLKIPQINQKIRESRIRSMLGVNDNLMALESEMSRAMEKEGMSKLTDRELTQGLQKQAVRVQFNHIAQDTRATQSPHCGQSTCVASTE